MIIPLVRLTIAGAVALGASVAGIVERCPLWGQPNTASFGWTAEQKPTGILMICIAETDTSHTGAIGVQLQLHECGQDAGAEQITLTLTDPAGQRASATCSGPGEVTCSVSAPCRPGTWQSTWSGSLTLPGIAPQHVSGPKPETSTIHSCA
jgi:hypothetical protein